jgi:hypothetical protein
MGGPLSTKKSNPKEPVMPFVAIAFSCIQNKFD